MENPVVDLEERTNEPVPGDELTRKLEWLDSSDEQNGFIILQIIMRMRKTVEFFCG